MDTRDRREEFLAAAAELFTHKGYAKTSVQDITDRVGITRSLFYHYFADKHAITDAVIDRQVNDFMTYIRNWTSQLNNANMHDALVELAGITRERLLAPLSMGDLVMREHNAALYQQFVVRCSQGLADYFVRTQHERGALIRYTHTCHPRESFYVLSVGIMSLMLRQPDTPDELIADLIADTLHVDLEARKGQNVGASKE